MKKQFKRQEPAASIDSISGHNDKGAMQKSREMHLLYVTMDHDRLIEILTKAKIHVVKEGKVHVLTKGDLKGSFSKNNPLTTRDGFVTHPRHPTLRLIRLVDENSDQSKDEIKKRHVETSWDLTIDKNKKGKPTLYNDNSPESIERRQRAES